MKIRNKLALGFRRMAGDFDTAMVEPRHAEGKTRRLNETLDERAAQRTAELRAEIAERERAEDDLRESERRFKDFAEAATDWFWEMDRKLRFSYFSDRLTLVTGIGIAPADIPKALSPFVQVDSTLSRKYAGTGLGLPLAKALVELHGGLLDLESEAGAGTTVTVRFPAERIVRERRGPVADNGLDAELSAVG